jgi:hypothetical protein
MIKILLISATVDFSFSGWVDQAAKEIKHQKAFIVPLHLATIAALTPAHYQVDLWDEIVQGPAENNLDAGYDLVGLTAYSDQLDRALEIAAAFRARNIPVVMGGAGVTAEPETVRGHVDVMFLGEAEETWPQFLADFETGQYAEVYKPDRFPDLSLSPAPCWDSIAHQVADNYKTGGVQINRGCPHRCEFCHVWIKYGRKIRTKPIPQVIREISALEKLGMKRVMFCTDNFIGDADYAKEVLRALIPVNSAFRHPLTFNTELTLKVAQDDELLGLLAEAGFTTLFIGIESTNLDSLAEARKHQNTRGDLLEQCRNINSFGIPVVGSMIVGFDNDTPDIFDGQFQFLQDACIPIPKLNILKAGKGTDLYDRALAEGRVLDMQRSFPAPALSNPMMHCNIIPKGMTRVQLYTGYLSLLERLWDWQNFGQRVLGFIDNISRMPERRPDERLLLVAERLRQMMLGMPSANASIIKEIYARASARVPCLLWEIASITMMQCYEAAQLPAERIALQKHIRLEEQLAVAGGPILHSPDGR